MADGTDVFVTVEASEATVSVVAQPVLSDPVLNVETLDVVVNVQVQPASSEAVLVEGGTAPTFTIITPEAEAALAEIEAARDAAATSASEAAGFRDAAEGHAAQADSHRLGAFVSMQAALGARTASEAARDAAIAAQAGAEAAESVVEAHKVAAEAARDAALAAQAGTEGAEALVEAHKIAAQAAATNAAASASAAAASETSAEEDATSAAASATAAASSASAANVSAYEADVKSAQAEQSRVAAVQAKNDAEAAETGAAASATSAAGSATSAASSATSANTSATGAATSAGAAAGSATASAASATQAADSATAAGDSAADALAAKEAAETASATSATSATNAAASATSAASSATAAETSATSAATSKTAAQAAQAAAEAARDEVLNSEAKRTWAIYATQWDFPPTQIATIGAGTVWRYRLDGVNRYRLVPSPYAAPLDAFYEAFDGTTLTGLIDTRGANVQPVANAGVDQSVDHSALVTLTAAGSSDADPDDTITYLWTQTSGPTVTLSSATAAQPTFTAPALTSSDLAQDLVFSLTVTDELGSSTVDTVTITVNPPPNQAPTANAGSDQTRDEGTLVTLDGRGSTDPDTGDVLSYLWTQISGPAVTLSDATAAQPTFTAPLVTSTETLVFSLVVTDDKGNSSAQDTVTITVQDVVTNNPPQAFAYWNNNTDPGGMTNDVNELIRLSADLSYDPDGDPLSYLWTQTAGTPVSLSEGVGPQDQFFFVPSVGTAETLSFSVTVSDGRGGTATATVDVSIEADPMYSGGGGGGYDTLTGGTAGPGGGSTPIAGLNWFNRMDGFQTAWSGAEIVLDGISSYDPEGHSISYTFTQTAGTPVDIMDEPIGPYWAWFIVPSVMVGEFLTFTLTVSDGVTSSTASVDIWINP